MRIEVLCSDPRNPVWPRLETWASEMRLCHEVALVSRSADLTSGDLLFLVSCHERIPVALRSRYRSTLVLHASDLPEGRGWSPHIWQILEGRAVLCVSLMEAVDALDEGPICSQRAIRLDGHELQDEINDLIFSAELDLMAEAVEAKVPMSSTPQRQDGATYYRRRTPDDSRLDPTRSIEDQFDLLRISDPVRYPAFFELRGHRYIVRIEKAREA